MNARLILGNFKMTSRKPRPRAPCWLHRSPHHEFPVKEEVGPSTEMEIRCSACGDQMENGGLDARRVKILVHSVATAPAEILPPPDDNAPNKSADMSGSASWLRLATCSSETTWSPLPQPMWRPARKSLLRHGRLRLCRARRRLVIEGMR